ncbi:p73 [Dendrolimus punctatus cypovirus 22]|uniref:p73 n=1 Tax=Dendrolimus punctatus cypovirus 22 TaxID=1577776 RepID=UPI0005401E13|nr:p73 [Dendrolimus punctatus cypovirus 22]AIY60600.1 p73 [Dendrolimus punctatus cypovirus 22]
MDPANSIRDTILGFFRLMFSTFDVSSNPEIDENRGLNFYESSAPRTKTDNTNYNVSNSQTLHSFDSEQFFDVFLGQQIRELLDSSDAFAEVLTHTQSGRCGQCLRIPYRGWCSVSLAQAIGYDPDSVSIRECFIPYNSVTKFCQIVSAFSQCNVAICYVQFDGSMRLEMLKQFSHTQLIMLHLDITSLTTTRFMLDRDILGKLFPGMGLVCVPNAIPVKSIKTRSICWTHTKCDDVIYTSQEIFPIDYFSNIEYLKITMPLGSAVGARRAHPLTIGCINEDEKDIKARYAKSLKVRSTTYRNIPHSLLRKYPDRAIEKTYDLGDVFKDGNIEVKSKAWNYDYSNPGAPVHTSLGGTMTELEASVFTTLPTRLLLRGICCSCDSFRHVTTYVQKISERDGDYFYQSAFMLSRSRQALQILVIVQHTTAILPGYILPTAFIAITHSDETHALINEMSDGQHSTQFQILLTTKAIDRYVAEARKWNVYLKHRGDYLPASVVENSFKIENGLTMYQRQMWLPRLEYKPTFQQINLDYDEGVYSSLESYPLLSFSIECVPEDVWSYGAIDHDLLRLPCGMFSGNNNKHANDHRCILYLLRYANRQCSQLHPSHNLYDAFADRCVITTHPSVFVPSYYHHPKVHIG